MSGAAGGLALFVTGGAGQLGSDLQRVAAGRSDVVGLRAVDLPDLDIRDPRAVTDAVADFAEWAREAAPEPRVVVLHCAAWTDVDGAEGREAEAYAVNAVGPANVARAAAAVGAEVVQVSTDYVFSGRAAEGVAADERRPWDPGDPVAPLNAYGRTKLAGEWAVRAECPRSWVVRTAWVYGQTGANFPKTIARLLRERDTVSVVADQWGTPTWSRDLAEGLLALAGSDAPYGTYHRTGGGQTTWFGFARAVAAAIGVDPERVLPTTSDAFPRPAARPAWSVLSQGAWLGAGLPAPMAWEDAWRAAAPAVVGAASA